MTMLKWLNSLTTVRHGVSEYNAVDRESIDGFREFADLFDVEYEALTTGHFIAETFPSPKLRALAEKVNAASQPEYSDYDTDLTPRGYRQAVVTGSRLHTVAPLPHRIYVSPYKRTRRTLEGLIEGWPELGKVKATEDVRIREQEHGKRNIYVDWRLYMTFNPEYAVLYKLSTGYEYKHEGGESLLDVKERVRSFIAMLIRKHGGAPETLTDKVLELFQDTRIQKLMNVLNVVPDTTPEDVMVVTHHLAILALRSNIEKWDREKYLYENEHNRPVNCGVSIYRGVPAPKNARRHERQGSLVMSSHEYNIKLYTDEEVAA